MTRPLSVMAHSLALIRNVARISSTRLFDHIHRHHAAISDIVKGNMERCLVRAYGQAPKGLKELSRVYRSGTVSLRAEESEAD